MITYDRLKARPCAFVSLSGMTLDDFEAVYQDFAAYAKDRRESLTRTGQQRKRAADAQKAQNAHLSE